MGCRLSSSRLISWRSKGVAFRPCMTICGVEPRYGEARAFGLFRSFARTLVGLSRTYLVSIGSSYLILSIRRYSSRTCSRTHLTSVPPPSRVWPHSVFTLFLSSFVRFLSLSRSLRHSRPSIIPSFTLSSDFKLFDRGRLFYVAIVATRGLASAGPA